MDDSTIIYLVKKSIKSLIKYDSWLLIKDLSERSISHKLAEHMQKRFSTYNVDCEYNGDVDQDNQRKRIYYIEGQEIQLNDGAPIQGEPTRRNVFPDIIIHRRGTNNHNNCIIEIKKSTSNEDYNIDRRKLQAYTMDIYGNNLNYQLGIFIVFQTNIEQPSYEIEYFKNGSNIVID